MARLFTGDYSTGKPDQWQGIQNYTLVCDGNQWPLGKATDHAINMVKLDANCGYAARFESRPGETAAGPNERTEVTSYAKAAAPEGSTRWYAFSIRFDDSWTNQSTLGWTSFLQFAYSPVHPTSPCLSFGHALAPTPGQQRNGFWYLMQNPLTTKPGGGWNYPANANNIAEFPLNPGQWHDIKMQVKWAKDNTGFVNLWRNGERVTFTAAGGGGETFTGQTMQQSGGSPGEEVVDVQIVHGIYRQPNVSPTGVVWHTGCRMADTEDSL